jgi:nucleotide-binding universal stress UspA family protein
MPTRKDLSSGDLEDRPQSSRTGKRVRPLGEEKPGLEDNLVGDSEPDIDHAYDRLMIRRILVALDASKYSQAVLETAAGLAAKLESELLGLFIEDINLLRLEEFPFVREIRFQQTIARRLETGEIQQKLRARAALLRHELEETAERYHVHSSFRVVRGPVDSELLSAALDADLLAVGQHGHSVGRRARLGSTARTALTRATSAVLLVRAGFESRQPVLVLFDGSTVSHRAVAAAVNIAGKTGDLRVLVWGVDDEAAYTERQVISSLLEPAGVKAEYQHFHSEDPEAVLELIKKQNVGLIVFGTSDSRLPLGIVQVILEEAPQHILLVR